MAGIILIHWFKASTVTAAAEKGHYGVVTPVGQPSEARVAWKV